jgi:ribose/xylose/arabinose/galactoside ABC-type transport system permease subunit
MRGSYSQVWGKITESSLFLPIAALLAILLFDLVLIGPNFFQLTVKEGHLYGSLIDILRNGSPTVILAMGMTLVIATGGVDLSVGAVMAIAASMACILINPTIVGVKLSPDILKILNNPDYSWAPLWLVVILPLIVATLCGAWNGMLVAYGRIQPMVATLVLMIAGRGIAQLITNAIKIIIFNDTYAYIGNGWIILPISLYIAVVVFLVAWLLTRRTAIGLFIESVGINFQSSFYSGINERRVKLFAYSFCGFCAGVAGLIATSAIRTSDANQIGLYTELDAILAVVIGGTVLGAGGRFSLLGSALGALVLQATITSMYAYGVAASSITAVKAVVVIAVIILYSEQAQGLIKGLGRVTARQEAAR